MKGNRSRSRSIEKRENHSNRKIILNEVKTINFELSSLNKKLDSPELPKESLLNHEGLEDLAKNLINKLEKTEKINEKLENDDIILEENDEENEMIKNMFGLSSFDSSKVYFLI